MVAVLIQIDGYDPVAAAAVTLRAASIDDERVCHLNSQLWWPAIAKLPALRYDLFDGGFGAQISSPTSSMSVAVEDWPNFPRYALADARFRLWTGNVGDAWGSYTLRFDGRISTQPSIAKGIAQLSFGVDDKWLDTPLLATYAGTSGAEGDAALKGQVKPLALGAPRFAPGQMINSANNVIQLSGYGLIEDVEVAFERVSRFGSSAGDYASYAALVAATVAPGSWATCKAAGLVRHGAPPAGKLAYHVKGDKAGPDGWVRLPGAVIKRIALLAGGTGKIDDSSLSALNSARPWNISVYVGEQTTARELIQRIAASVNAVAGVDWLGKLFVAPVGFGTPSQILDNTGASLPPIVSVEQVSVDAPWWRLAMGSQPTWAVHDIATDVAFDGLAPVDLGLYDPTTVYRENNLVNLGDGSRFRYISTTPGSGNAPPTPTSPPAAPAANGYWEQIAPPLISLTGRLTNESHVVTADASGNVVSYSGASGSFQVFDGGADVSSSFALSTVANPQALTVNYSAQTYTVTAGLDAGEPSAVLTIRATGSGAYAGKSVDRVFSIAKAVGGAAGSNNAIVYVYQRATSAPAVPSATVTYTFASGGISGLNNGWTAAIPAGTNPLYVTTAVASGTGTTDTIATGEWATPVVLSKDGVDGAPGAGGPAGANAATVFLYQRNDTGTAPSVPASTLTYTFATGVLSGTLGSWTQTIPDSSTGAYLFVTTATALGTGTTDTIGTAEWAAVRLMSQDGNYRDVKYIRSLPQPSTPTGASPVGWSDAPPPGADTLWSTVAPKDFAGNLLSDWSTPQSLSGLTPRGDYDGGASYYLNNSVSYGGGSYIAVQDDFSGHAPTGTGQANAYWDVLAAPGSPGTPATPPSAFSATINLTSGAAVNLRSIADANGYTGLSNATITFNVPNGVTIRGLGGALAGIGIDSGSWPTSTYTITLTLVVQSGGVVDGGGGAGANAPSSSGAAGGDAIYCRLPMTVTINSGGTVRAGGGGGGSGKNVTLRPAGEIVVYGGGGGGGGAPNGPAGSGNASADFPGSNGSAGTTSGGGSGGASGGSSATAGAAGGGYATAGGDATSGGTGGVAGYAVRKNGNTVTVSNSGTMTGTAA